ncbi:P-loop containing nucleoside triphosphate hydrolase protein [Lentinula raphanica]|nr:P-loop containing nucleoside triphosphate hydrolase protein [Lentinula raphanica]
MLERLSNASQTPPAPSLCSSRHSPTGLAPMQPSIAPCASGVGHIILSGRAVRKSVSCIRDAPNGKYPDSVAGGFDSDLAALLEEPSQDDEEYEDADTVSLLFSNEEAYSKYLDFYVNQTAYSNLKNIEKRLGYPHYLNVLFDAQTGPHGSVDTDDFLTKEIKGPASFSCTSGDPNAGSSFAGDSSPNNCKFSEATMNQLINDVFDGPPTFHPPKPDYTTWVALNAVGTCLFVVLVALLLWYVGRTGSGGDYGNGGIKLPEPGKRVGSVILTGISGAVRPGQVMAIMGASSAGKSTLLDILAQKTKWGIVGGEILMNGRVINDAEFEQSLDTHLGHQGQELGSLFDIPWQKWRVLIACELVTSPSILFLNEPTSGLDVFNAFNVIESLVPLAKNYHPTVIFTIHQPRSNIVALSDQLLVLAMGRVVYSGEFGRCGDYFNDIGKPCPPGFNTADYLIDLTVQPSIETRSPSPTLELNSPEDDTATGETTVDAGPTDDTKLQLQTRARLSSQVSLLINRETVMKALQFLHTISFFPAAFEALAVNELSYPPKLPLGWDGNTTLSTTLSAASGRPAPHLGKAPLVATSAANCRPVSPTAQNQHH